MTGSKTVGHFMWIKTMTGVPTCEKMERSIYEGHTTTSPAAAREYREKLIGGKHDLNEEEFGWTLEKLAEKYPCPVPSSSTS